MSNRPRHLLLLLLATALTTAAIVSGCGSSDEGTTQASVTKASFIREADKICAAADKGQEARLNVLAKVVKKTGKPFGDEVLIKRAGLPPLVKAVEELSELPLPEDGGQAKAIVTELEAAVEKAEKNPTSLVKTQTPFTSVLPRARAYGLRVCGLP